MSHVRAALARLAGLWSARPADAELREEMESHLEMETAEHVRRGVPPDEARRLALLSSGGLTLAAEAVRDQRGLPWVSGVASDVRYALRALRQAPAFTVLVVLTLALGIGANTAIFSVVRGVLLKPLPHREGNRLVYLRHSSDGAASANLTFSVPEVRAIRAGAPSLGGVAEYSSWFHTLQGDDDAISIDVGLVTGNYFEVMGLAPVLGRLTQPTDDGPAAAPVMVLSHEFWLTRFGGDSSIVGQTLRVDGTPVLVVGVVQPAPFFPDRVDALLNMVISPHHLSAMMVDGHAHRMTELVARLAPGATAEQAHAEVAAVLARMQADHAEAYDPIAQHRIAVIPFREVLGERARLTLWLLMGVAAFVMVITAANVVNLTLMRGVRREQELVVRAALGAGTARLRRLLLIENLALSVSGALLGVLVAMGGVGMLSSLAARYSPRASEIRLDTAVLGFALALAVSIALLLSFVASLPREGTFASLAAGARRMTGSLRKHRLQRALVVAQVAVSFVLLTGAGLLTRTMLSLSQVDTGLLTEQVLTMPIPLINPARMDEASEVAAREQYYRMQRELRSLPGVRDVALGSTMPLRRAQLSFDLALEGRPGATGAALPHADFRTASPEYFRAAGIPFLQGRAFADTDRAGTERVVVINQTLADRHFAGESPIGRRIAWTGEVLQYTPVSGDWRTIVGVVGDTRDGGLDAEPRAVVFAPFAQEFPILGGLVIRADGTVDGLAAAATRVVRRIAPTVPIENVLTVAQIKEESVAPRRFNAVLVASLGLLAVLIAAVGIAGVLAFSVTARTTEIGIRMSLGAQRGRVQRMILREGGMLLGLGLVLGGGASVLATRVIQGLLFGVAPHDPATILAVAVTMAVLGIGACWLPARRAARIDPAIAMRT